MSHVSCLKTSVLYGGSVNSKNIGDYVWYDEVDGALVGGASLKANEWEKMVHFNKNK
jgi:triosephosphate isomerase